MKRMFIALALIVLFANSALYASRPVAQWDVIPDQLLDEPFNAGVVAVHLEGVKVEFRINSTLVYTAENPVYNPRTDLWEHVLEIDPADYPDGPITVDARAICLSGDNVDDPDYDLPSITLHTNNGGTLGTSVQKWADSVNGSDSNPGTEAAPYATLVTAVKNTPEGGTVYLKPGSYIVHDIKAGVSRVYWTTIRPADGVSRDQVIIEGGGRPKTEHLKFQDVSFIWNYVGSFENMIVGENGSTTVWMDNCYFENTAGRWNGNLNYFGNRYRAYVTGGEGHNMGNGPFAYIVRDHHLYDLRSDSWTGGDRLVVNSSVNDVDPGSTGAHPDFHQSYAPVPDFVENVILYNVRAYDCKCQGFFGSRLKNSAFVNILFELEEGQSASSQYGGPMENVLFAHITLARQRWVWGGTGSDAYDPTDVNMVNNIFNDMSYYADAVPSPELVIDYNHFSGISQGTNITTGDPMYVDMDANDFRLDPASPAVGNGITLQCVPADIEGNPYSSSGRNRGCFAAVAARLPGDADEDSDVDIMDFLILKSNYGTSAGATWQMGDFDDDGDVDINDFLVLKANYGKSSD